MVVINYRKGKIGNEISVENNIAKMKLYNNKNIPTSETDFDEEFIDNIKQFTWFKQNQFGYVSCHFKDVNGNKRCMQLHRYILYLNGNLDHSLDVDHKDGNPLNNLKNNLRICTASQNTRNSRRKRNSISQYKGVSFFKRDQKWKAEIYINGKNSFLGLFINEIDAAKAYNTAAILHFGEFAKLNNV